MSDRLERLLIWVLLAFAMCGLYFACNEWSRLNRGCTIMHRIDSNGTDYYVKECRAEANR